MSDQVFDQYDAAGATQSADQSNAQAAAEEAKSVAKAASESGKAVAETAKDEVAQVAGEAKNHARDMYDQARTEVSSQAATQQQRAAELLRSLTGEMQQMASSGQGGMASGLVNQAADQAQRVAGWLESREPGDLLEDVKRYARRNPGNFLAAAALLGFMGGRVTRNLAGNDDDADSVAYPRQTRPVAPVTPGAVTTQHVPSAAPAYGGGAVAPHAPAADGIVAAPDAGPRP